MAIKSDLLKAATQLNEALSSKASGVGVSHVLREYRSGRLTSEVVALARYIAALDKRDESVWTKLVLQTSLKMIAEVLEKDPAEPISPQGEWKGVVGRFMDKCQCAAQVLDMLRRGDLTPDVVSVARETFTLHYVMSSDDTTDTLECMDEIARALAPEQKRRRGTGTTLLIMITMLCVVAVMW
jgi:hypothetical protein